MDKGVYGTTGVAEPSGDHRAAWHGTLKDDRSRSVDGVVGGSTRGRERRRRKRRTAWPSRALTTVVGLARRGGLALAA